MQLPLSAVLQRGTVFLWHQYGALDDPSLVGQTRPKFIVVLSTSSADDPLIFVLTTSEKPKHASAPHPEDFFKIAAGTYGFFPSDTLIDVSEAGELDIASDQFAALYKSGAVTYKGSLATSDIASLMKMISECPRVPRRFKRVLSGN
jgi:hypothetical protein